MIHRLTDKSVIRAYLNTDREWSLYALADLDDGMFEDCDWWSSGDNLALVFRALEIRPILVLGDPRKLLPYLPERSGYLNLKPEQFDGAQDFYAYRERHQMNRMIVDEFTPHAGEAEPLTRHDRKAIEELYATGDGGGIAFAPFQLDTGFFRGVRHGNELVAVAGVHVVSHNESVAGVGNIFTRPDCRGRGSSEGGNVERRRGSEGSWDSNHWPQRRAHKRARNSGLPTPGFPHSISLLRRRCGSCGRAAPVGDYFEALRDAFYVIRLSIGIPLPGKHFDVSGPALWTKYVNCGASIRIIRPLFREAQ